MSKFYKFVIAAVAAISIGTATAAPQYPSQQFNNVIVNGSVTSPTSPISAGLPTGAADDANLIGAFQAAGASGKPLAIPGNTYKLITQDMVPWGYGPLGGVEVSAGGHGYVNGDTITVGGLNGNTTATAGVCATRPVLTVTNAIGGVIQAGGVSISTAGNCSAGPSGSVIQSATSGAGTGAVFSLGWSNYYSTAFSSNPSANYTGGGFLDYQFGMESLGHPDHILNGYQVNVGPSNVPFPGQQYNVFNITARNTTTDTAVVAFSSFGESASATAANNSAWGINTGCSVSVTNGQCYGQETDILSLAPGGTYHGLTLAMDGYYAPAAANAIEIRGRQPWHNGIVFLGGVGNSVSGTLITSTTTSTPLLGVDWRNSIFGLNEYTSPSFYIDKTVTNWNTASGAVAGVTGSASASPAIYALPYQTAISNNANLRVIGGNGGNVLLQTGMTSRGGSGGSTPVFTGAVTQVSVTDTPGASKSVTLTGGRAASTTNLATSVDTPSGTVLPFVATTGVAIGMSASGTNVAGKVIAVASGTVTLDTAVSGDVPSGTSVAFTFAAQQPQLGTSDASNLYVTSNLDFANNALIRALGTGALQFGNEASGTQFAIQDSGGPVATYPVLHGAASGGSVTYGQGGSAANTSFVTGGSTYFIYGNANGNILQLLGPTVSAVNRVNITSGAAGTSANITANQGDLSLGTSGASGQAVIALGATADQAVSVFTSGATGTVTNNTDRAILAATVTSPFALTMPAAPRDGQPLLIECDASITLTIAANSGQNMVGSAAACSTTQGHSWHYRAADTKWRMDY